MLFYQSIINIESTKVGIIYLIGQITDGLAASIFGQIQDLDLNMWICHTYGRRKVNHNIFDKTCNVLIQ